MSDEQNTTIDDNLFDKRVVERNIKRGKITREQYEAYLHSLEDCEPLAVRTDTRFASQGDEDEDDEDDEDLDEDNED